MSRNWEKIKRNSGKIGTGLVVIGGVSYLAKKIYDYNYNDSSSNGNTSNTNLADEALTKRQMFASYQETCEKILKDVIQEFDDSLLKNFNCEELVERLRNENLLHDEKLGIWKELRVRAFSRVLAMANAYALIVVVYKVQHTILCKDIYARRHTSATYSSSWVDALAFFFGPEQTSVDENQQTDEQVAQLFSNCIKYFRFEGILDFCMSISDTVRNKMRSISFSDKFSPTDLRQLIASLVSTIDVFGRYKQYSRFVVPDASPVVLSSINRSEHFKALLESFVGALNSVPCRNLLTEFAMLHMDNVYKQLESDFPKGCLQMAKIIPIVTDAFEKIAKTNEQSVFQETLQSHEMNRYLQKLFNS